MPLLEIETARLHLSPCSSEDVEVLHGLWTDPDVRRYLWDDQVISRDQAREQVEVSLSCFSNQGYGLFVVRPKEPSHTPQPVIGFCSLRPLEWAPEPEILYGLKPASWGRGLATEAARAVLRWGFDEHPWPRLWAGADPPNTASFQVMERLGMSFVERRLENNVEALYYAVARRDFDPGDSFYLVGGERSRESL